MPYPLPTSGQRALLHKLDCILQSTRSGRAGMPARAGVAACGASCLAALYLLPSAVPAWPGPCMHACMQVDAGLEFRAYYAGHVLGAVMFYAKAGTCSVVYTGDYNASPDRHLGAAALERLRPDVLITEVRYRLRCSEGVCGSVGQGP